MCSPGSDCKGCEKIEVCPKVITSFPIAGESDEGMWTLAGRRRKPRRKIGVKASKKKLEH